MNLDLATILYTVFIQPLQFTFEIIFSVANKFTNHPGLSIIVLSLIMNFLVLPLYKRADDMQEEQRKIDEKLKKGVDHIKKAFNGDERMMILQTYYRQNDYKPTDALNGSISLLLEVPFFIAAYQFLSHLTLLEGVSLGPIQNLGQPDAMFIIGGFTVNVLPVLMTLINVISSAIYLKGFPLKTKIQLYSMALFFLFFLYESPAGLVFYWTLNNLFSLCKNIFYKLKNPGKVLSYLFSIVGLAILGFVFFVYETKSIKRKLFLVVIGILLQLPFIISKIKSNKEMSKKKTYTSKYINILLTGLILAVFVGFFIPSSVISSSPEEFISITYFHNPINFPIYSLLLSFGFFVVWVGVFYWIADDKFKVVIERVLYSLLAMFVLNYMCFGSGLGNLLPNLQYEEGIHFASSEMLINLGAILLVIVTVLLFTTKFKKHIPSLLCIVLISFSVLSGSNVNTINTVVADYQEKVESMTNELPHYSLSKSGKNVVIIVLDRALNYQVQYIFNEKPELKEKFAGFTHYTNSLSFGAYTNFGMPALFGGYEYTPLNMNLRENESLVSKHNEALKVLPVLYSQNGYNVTMMDPAYANYQWVPDLSIYDEYPDIKSYITEGKFNDPTMDIQNVNNNYRNFFCYSVMRSMPLFLQSSIYQKGEYHRLSTQKVDDTEVVYSTQTTSGTTKSSGISNNFMKGYNVLLNLKSMTKISDDNSNNFMMMVNNTTHEPMLLQTPNYVPSMNVDNTEYFESVKDKYTINGQTLKMETSTQVIHYHANMATFIQLGEWFDYLRENGVYDNTKIILVSDHGRSLNQIEELDMGNGDDTKNVEYFSSLLLVKDYNSKEFNVSDEFMTNGDVPTIALQGNIDNPVNPFTGKAINSTYKNTNDLYVIRSKQWRTNVNNGNTFLPSKWAIVKDDIWNKNNWTFLDKEVVHPK